MKLYEVFNKTVEWHWAEKTKHQWEAEFTIDGRLYVVYFLNCTDYFGAEEPKFESIEVAFSIVTAPAKDPSMRGREVEDITGTGDAFVVFATVKEILFEYLQQNQKVGEIMFTAKEPSRIKLYQRFAKLFVRAGWKLTQPNPSEWQLVRGINNAP